jgi:hypothetical protein
MLSTEVEVDILRYTTRMTEHDEGRRGFPEPENFAAVPFLAKIEEHLVKSQVFCGRWECQVELEHVVVFELNRESRTLYATDKRTHGQYNI